MNCLCLMSLFFTDLTCKSGKIVSAIEVCDCGFQCKVTEYSCKVSCESLQACAQRILFILLLWYFGIQDGVWLNPVSWWFFFFVALWLGSKWFAIVLTRHKNKNHFLNTWGPLMMNPPKKSSDNHCEEIWSKDVKHQKLCRLYLYRAFHFRTRKSAFHYTSHLPFHTD